MSRTLTGRELRYAAEHALPVRYVEKYANPHDRHMNFNGVCVMRPARAGYYIGNSDIDPTAYGDDDLAEGNFDEGWFAVKAHRSCRYGPSA